MPCNHEEIIKYINALERNTLHLIKYLEEIKAEEKTLIARSRELLERRPDIQS